MYMENIDLAEVVTPAALDAMLGVQTPVPITSAAMARSLEVVFAPAPNASPRVASFVQRLQGALRRCGATVTPYEEALLDGEREKLRDNIVIIGPGEMITGDLPVDHVSNLRKTTLVGIVDGPCPADEPGTSQEKLNSIVSALAWHVVQVVIYVDPDAWTVCTMNGAIIKSRLETFEEDVFGVLVPKIAAPVVPPHASDFDIRDGALDLSSEKYRPYIEDFQKSAHLWAQTGLMLFHTELDSLRFRNRFYQRVVAAYLDHRSGMSYGFLARQPAGRPGSVLSLQNARDFLGEGDWQSRGVAATEDALYVTISIGDEPLVLRIPDVWMLTTRSGCDKSNINAKRDIVLMGLSRGRVIFATPQGVNHGIDCKPSYDTLTILSHALGNALIADIQETLTPAAQFAAQFRTGGMALAHWHGTLDEAGLPVGYFLHGDLNPPVSCSTFQAAIYALGGKLKAFAGSLRKGSTFMGDVHLERHHGVNVTGPSLTALAEWILRGK
jgi:hypothetical protein